MSNGLWMARPWELLAGAGATSAASQALGPASRPALHSPVLTVVVALGLVAMAAVAIRLITQPKPLNLLGTPGRPNRLNVLHLIAVLLPWFLLLSLVSGLAEIWLNVNLAAAAKLKDHTDPVFLLSLQVTIIKALVGLVWMIGGSLVIGAIAFRGGVRRGLGLSGRHWLWDGVRGVVGFFAVMPLCLGLLWASSYLLRTCFPDNPELLKPHVLLVALKALPLPWQAGAFVGAAVLAPLAEELFFRGLVQSMIRRATQSPWTAILVTSSLFALMHYQTLNAVPSLMVLAIVLGFLYEQSGRLASPMIVHALFNIANMLSVLSGG